ncbi:MAG: hypothetical protein PHO07_20895, partial [Pirellulales bacterium]|nr:hypothetical protein [Pirellulales bacterium]
MSFWPEGQRANRLEVSNIPLSRDWNHAKTNRVSIAKFGHADPSALSCSEHNCLAHGNRRDYHLG